jgi:hypothetical protein
MIKKYFVDHENPEEYDQCSSYSFPTLKQSDILFDEDDDIVYPVLSIRRAKLPKNGEEWEIIEDGKIVLILRGSRFTKKEKNVLRTPEGIKAVLDEYKSGTRSVNKIKNLLKRMVESE